MAGTEIRNPDGTFAPGNVSNPTGKNGHLVGWQPYRTRLQRFLNMPMDELMVLAADEEKLMKLPVIDVGAIRHAREIGIPGTKHLDYLNAALDRLEGKAVQRQELSGPDGEPITLEHREFVRSKLLSAPAAEDQGTEDSGAQ
jgi:hypothetical protein